MQFTWDPKKAATNLQKHGVSFEEATTVFADPLALIEADAVHAERSVMIGQSAKRRMVFTVFVELSDDIIRIISARRAIKRERRQYEGDEG